MIAPEPRIFKGLTVQELGPRIKRTALPVRCWARSLGDHGFVNGIIMLPQFGQGDAKPKSMMAAVASGPVLEERRIPQPPSPPGFVEDRASCFRVTRSRSA